MTRALRATILLALLLVLLATLASCYRTTLLFDPAPPEPSSRKLRRTHLIGLIELDTPIVIDALCPQGTAAVYQRQGAISIGLGIITFGFANGREIEVWCRGGARYHATTGKDGKLHKVRRADL